MPVNVQLLIIDPQVDFCDPNGSLFVPGSTEDIDRLSLMVKRLKNKISDIHVTLDSHHPMRAETTPHLSPQLAPRT